MKIQNDQKYGSAAEISACLRSGLRARTVNPKTLIVEVVREASRDGLGYGVENGGGVPNCYNYPAKSECIGAVMVRTHGRGGRGYLSYTTLPANKITMSGTANATLGVRSPWDNRMVTAQSDIDWLREEAWNHGDIVWRETPLGGLWYRVEGKKWVSAKDKIIPSRSLPTKPAMRAMRRLARDGWRVVNTPSSQGAKPSPAFREIATGEEYHVDSDSGRYLVSAAKAAKAFETRRQAREDKELSTLLDSGRCDGVYVCLADSLRAGNCRQGSESFAARHRLDISRHYTAGDLRAIANGDARFVRAALLVAIRRNAQECARGFANLSDHFPAVS